MTFKLPFIDKSPLTNTLLFVIKSSEKYTFPKTDKLPFMEE